METQDLENMLKMIRTARMLTTAAAGCQVTDTAREFNLIAAAATMRELARQLTAAAATATAEADEAERRAAVAAAERKQAKRQATE